MLGFGTSSPQDVLFGVDLYYYRKCVYQFRIKIKTLLSTDEKMINLDNWASVQKELPEVIGGVSYQLWNTDIVLVIHKDFHFEARK